MEPDTSVVYLKVICSFLSPTELYALIMLIRFHWCQHIWNNVWITVFFKWLVVQCSFLLEPNDARAYLLNVIMSWFRGWLLCISSTLAVLMHVFPLSCSNTNSKRQDRSQDRFRPSAASKVWCYELYLHRLIRLWSAHPSELPLESSGLQGPFYATQDHQDLSICCVIELCWVWLQQNNYQIWLKTVSRNYSMNAHVWIIK